MRALIAAPFALAADVLDEVVLALDMSARIIRGDAHD